MFERTSCRWTRQGALVYARVINEAWTPISRSIGSFITASSIRRRCCCCYYNCKRHLPLQQTSHILLIRAASIAQHFSLTEGRIDISSKSRGASRAVILVQARVVKHRQGVCRVSVCSCISTRPPALVPPLLHITNPAHADLI